MRAVARDEGSRGDTIDPPILRVMEFIGVAWPSVDRFCEYLDSHFDGCRHITTVVTHRHADG